MVFSDSCLVDIVKDVFRKTLLVGSLVVPLSFVSCEPEPDPVPDPVEYPPSGNMYVSPKSGFAPLSVDLSLTGIQKTNLLDSLYLFSDGVKVAAKKASSFDTTMVFLAGTHSLYAKFVDVKGLSYLTPVTSIVASQNPAKAELSLSNTSGVSPVSSHVQLSGTPGPNPFKTYKLHISGSDFNGFPFVDRVISRGYPIDTVMNFYAGNYSVRGEIVDSKGVSIFSDLKSLGIDMDNPVFWNRSDYPVPIGPVDFFVYPGDAEYNSLTTKSQRDNAIENARATDITPNIPTGLDFIINGITYGFVCGQASALFEYNCHDWKDLYTTELVVQLFFCKIMKPRLLFSVS